MVEPKKVHWFPKQVFRYLRGVVHFGLRYVGDKGLVAHGFTDPNWASVSSDRGGHFKVLLWFGFRYGVLVQREESFSGT